MNKLSRYIVIITSFFISISSYGQEPMVKLYEINGSGNKKIEIPFEETGIVDINSTISLELHIDQIETELLAFHGISRDDSRLKELEKLNKILAVEIDLTNYLNQRFDESNREAQLNYFRGLDQLTIGLIDAIELDSALYSDLIDPKATIAFSKYAIETSGSYPEFIIHFLNQKADKIRKEIISSLGLSGKDSSFQVYFRLGAFLRDKNGGRPIHVENFDEYDQESYQELGRFGKPVTKQEQEALQETAKLNNQLGGEIATSLNHYKGIAEDYKDELTSFKSSYDELNSVYGSSMENLGSSRETSIAALVLANNLSGLNKIGSLYTTLHNHFEEIEGLFTPQTTNYEKLNKTLDLLNEIISERYQSFSTDVNEYQSSSEATKHGKEALASVEIGYKGYVDAASEDIKEVKTFIQKIRNAIRPFRKAYLENEEFSNKVNRFELGDIPSNGYIELNYIGTVKPGDEILIKATLERGVDRRNAKFEQKQIYRKVVKIRRISPYIKMSGSIIMANPYTRDDIPAIDLENSFQFAPTYGIILKWGSRKNNFYNNFIDLGVGLAFSSPDFNTDGTPEFGAGIMLTAFKDILSVGWGRNFGLDAPYTFIGFNIPFSIGGLPSDNAGRFNN